MRFPEIVPLLAEHIEEDGLDPPEIYSHIFFERQFGTWFNALLESGSESDLKTARSIADFLEETRVLTSDEGVLALLRVTFVEIFPWRPESQARAAGVLGPTLLQDYRDWLEIMSVPVTI